MVRGIVINYFQNKRKANYTGNPTTGAPADELKFGDELKDFCEGQQVPTIPSGWSFFRN